MSFSTSKKGLWHILVGMHRLIALHISHAMCKDTVAGRNDKMPTYYASSIAAASFLLLLAVALALCKGRHCKAHPASIASRPAARAASDCGFGVACMCRKVGGGGGRQAMAAQGCSGGGGLAICAGNEEVPACVPYPYDGA